MTAVAATRHLMAQVRDLPATPTLDVPAIVDIARGLHGAVGLLGEAVEAFIEKPESADTKEAMEVTLGATLQVLIGLALSQGFDPDAAVWKMVEHTAKQQELKSPPAYVTVEAASYESDQEDIQWLTALEAAGVDNWQGYDDAKEILKEMKNDD